MRQGNKRQVSVYLESDKLDLFQRKYPYIMAKFIRNCIKIAIQDEDFAFKVFNWSEKQ